MQHDKKVSNGQLRFVLIKGIGEAYLTADVEKQVYSVIEKSLSGDLLTKQSSRILEGRYQICLKFSILRNH